MGACGTKVQRDQKTDVSLYESFQTAKTEHKGIWWDKWNQRCLSPKIGIVGDPTEKSEIFKTQFSSTCTTKMTKTIEYMTQIIDLKDIVITLDAWSLRKSSEAVNLVPNVATGAVAMLFVFDLMDETTIESAHYWFKWTRKHNQVTFHNPILTLSV